MGPVLALVGGAIVVALLCLAIAGLVEICMWDGGDDA